MPGSIIGSVTIWLIALLVPAGEADSSKLAVHEFTTQQECESNIPYLKRYYRLYGERWSGECVESVRHLPATRRNYGSM